MTNIGRYIAPFSVEKTLTGMRVRDAHGADIIWVPYDGSCNWTIEELEEVAARLNSQNKNAEIKEYRLALEFYANPDIYVEDETPSLPVNDIPIGSIEADEPEILEDGGRRAQAALREGKK